MPIVIPKSLPAFQILTKERIFVMPQARAIKQDIRPIRIAIVNLMPTKIDTETQLMRLLGNSPLQIEVTLVAMDSYTSRHTPLEHMEKFYKTFDQIKDTKFDGMIITGAPVEQMAFEEVAYWNELTRIMDFCETNVTSTIYICWGAQAGLYYHYGINKHNLDKKLFGVCSNVSCDTKELLLKGMDDTIYIPMSRHTAVDDHAIAANPDLVPLAYGDDCGYSIIKSKDNRKFFFMGHSEYDRETLRNEYLRDKEKGLDIEQPFNYFVGRDINKIDMKWKSTANLLFYNWLNYYVYQVTPYDLTADMRRDAVSN